MTDIYGCKLHAINLSFSSSPVRQKLNLETTSRKSAEDVMSEERRFGNDDGKIVAVGILPIQRFFYDYGVVMKKIHFY